MTKAEIQLIRSLADKRARIETGLFVAEGEKLISEIRSSHLRIRKIFSLEGLFAGSEVEVVTPKERERLSLLKTPSKALALVESPHYELHPAKMNNQLVLALDEVQNPGNLGTIIRVADWFGIQHIFCSAGPADAFSPKTVQATMGAVARVKVHYTDLPEYLTQVRQKTPSVPFYGTFLEGENIYKEPLSTNGIIIMGNEGNGISSTIQKMVTHKLFIPNYPEGCATSESLNVAIATAITCAEFRRRG